MGDYVGARVRYWRTRRGMSQTALAGLASISQGYLSKIESGVQDIDKRSTLLALASALRVSVTDLLGQPGDPTDPVRARVAEHVPAIRAALAELLAGERPPSRLPEPELALAVDRADRYRQSCDYGTLTPMLPALLRDVSRHSALLTRVAYSAASLLCPVGHRDLAWHAANLCLSAAEDSGDLGLIGRARYQHFQSQPMESSAVIARLATRAADGLEEHLGQGDVRCAYGMLHLRAGLCAAIVGKADDTAAHLAVASEQATLTGEPASDDNDYRSLSFGPTNVGLWRMAMLNELGEYGRVVEISRGLHPERLPAANRTAAYWTDLGCALSRLRNREREAIVAFVNAERAAPEWVRPQPQVREAVHAMICRARHRSVADDLRRLAQRVGTYALAE